MPPNKPPPSFFIVPDEKKNYNSSVKLGNIIYQIKRPDLVLFHPDKAMPQLPVEDLSENKTLKKYVIEKGDEKSSKYGLFAKILEFFSFGLNISHSAGADVSERYEIKSMTIEAFEPSPSFMAGIEAQNSVMDILKDGSPPCAFLITGRVIASGVVFKSKDIKDNENEGSFGVNVHGVAVGPSGKRSKRRTLKIDWEDDGPTVLAYKVKKLQLKDGNLTAEDEEDGAYFGDDGPKKHEVDFDAKLEGSDIGGLSTESVRDDFTQEEYNLYLPDD